MTPHVGDDPVHASQGQRSLDRQPVFGQAIDAIKDMIEARELAPGQQLPPERTLAQLLGISRPTLRQAIGALSAMNILESRHGGGTFVSSLSPTVLAEPIAFLLQINDKSVRSLFEVRQVLEVSAAGLAADRISPARLAILSTILDDAEASKSDAERFTAADIRFHNLIVEALDNEIYSSLHASIASLSERTRSITATRAQVRARANKDHLAIAAALRNRDAEQAREAMRQHLDEMWRAYMRASASTGSSNSTRK